MTMNEECVNFKNKDEHILRGILHHANDKSYRKISLIILNTGLNDMVGWHRLQVKIARYLAEQGYNVLRYDDAGIGDSEGSIESDSIVEIFSDIETGRFVSNANGALNFIADKFKDERYIYLGFCGGGLTAVISACDNKKIDGIVDIAGPITLSSNEYLHKKDPWEVKKNVEKYKSKLLQFGPWFRFFTGRGEYANVYKSITNYFRHKLKGQYAENNSNADDPAIKNLNHKFFTAFDTYAKTKRPLLFYFAELDSATWEFRKYFLNKYENSEIWDRELYTYIEIEKANHIFSSLEAQKAMKSDVLNWLEKYFN